MNRRSECSSGAWALRLNERNIQYAFRLRRLFNEGNIERIEMSSGTIKSVEREHWTQSVVKWRAWLRFRGIIKQLNEAGEPVHLDHWLLDGSKIELCVFLMCKWILKNKKKKSFNCGVVILKRLADENKKKGKIQKHENRVKCEAIFGIQPKKLEISLRSCYRNTRIWFRFTCDVKKRRRKQNKTKAIRDVKSEENLQ